MNPTTVPPVSAARIVKHGELVLVGLSHHYAAGGNAGIPSQWSRFAPHIGQIANEVPDISYGVVYHVDAANNFDYLCGVEVRGAAHAPDGCTTLTIPAHTYAVFEHRAHVS